MNSFARIGIGAAMLVGLGVAPASSVLAADWGSDRHYGDHPHESHAPSAHDFHSGSPSGFHGAQRNMDRGASPVARQDFRRDFHSGPSSEFQGGRGRDFRGGASHAFHGGFHGGAASAARNMPPSEFRGAPPGFHADARNFQGRDFNRSFDRNVRGAPSHEFDRSAARDFRGAPSRDFNRGSTRDFRGARSHDFNSGSGRDFHGASRQGFHGGSSHQVRGFHGHDFAQFTPQEHQTWSRGTWQHTWHNGHFGWWWDCDDFWFFYLEPIYTFPTFVSYYYDDDYYGDGYGNGYGYGASDYSWYWCDEPEGYYPYVQTCEVPWRPVSPSQESY